MNENDFILDKVKLGRKGQITIPKKIREKDRLKEEDVFIVTHMPGGDIILRKQSKKDPEDVILEALSKAPSFDWQKAWKEVVNERKRERS